MRKASTTFVRLSFIVLALCFLPVFLAAFEASAQEPRFFTKSQGARDAGLAQLRARLSQAESDLNTAESNITGLQANWTSLQNMSDTCADAFANGANDDLILFWNTGGGVWDCGSEIDPTVQSWAKAALPSCGAGQVLSVTGNAFSCVDNAGASIEVDPHIRSFADTRQSLLNCGANEVLTADGSDLVCTANSGAGVETDPTVEGFAKVSLPTCGIGQVLRANGTSFSCVNDAGGSGSPISLAGLSDTLVLTPGNDQVLKWNGSVWVNAAESDPSVTAWAKTAITGGTAGACNANQVLTADDASALDCTDIDTLVGSNLGLDDLNDVTITSAVANQVLAWNGAAWVNAAETDPGVETFAKTTLPACAPDEVLTGSGGNLSCVSAATAVGDNLTLNDLGDTNITAPVNGGALVWDSGSSRWIDAPATRSFAQAALPTCSGTEVLTGSGGNLSCTSAATAVGSGLNLSDLGDTSIASVGAGEDGYALTWDNASGNWVASVPTAGDADTLDGLDSLQFVRSDESDSLVGDYDITGALSTTGNLTVDTTTLHVDAANNRVGIGTASPGVAVAHIANTGNAASVLIQRLDANGSPIRIASGVDESALIFDGGDKFKIRSNATTLLSAESATTGSPIMTFDGATQRVGIGTETPTVALDVAGTVSATQVNAPLFKGVSGTKIELNDAIAGPTGNGLNLSGANNVAIMLDASNNDTGGNLIIGHNSSDPNIGPELFRFTEAGHFGIGTNNPTTPLHVVGSGLFTGNVTAADPTAGAHLATKDYVDAQISGNNAISQDDSAVTVTDLGTGVVTVDVDATRIASYRVGGTTFDTGFIRATSGTAVAPMYSFINDTDTGPFLAADGTYAITTGGTERFRIDASGNVGIGTAPSQELDVLASGTGIARFMRDLTTDTGLLIDASSAGPELKTQGAHNLDIFTNGTARMRIDSTGNVGIGTTSPDEALGLVGNMRIFGAAGNTEKYIDFWADSDAGGGEGFQIGRLAFYGRQNDTDPTSFRLKLWNNDTNELIEPLRVTHTGNVGIGTTAPTETLDVSGSVAVAASLTVDTDTLVVDNVNNRVGIGTSVPLGNLDISDAALASTPSPVVDDLIIRDSDYPGINIISDVDGYNAIFMGDTAAPNKGGIVYNNILDMLTISANGNTAMTINNGRNVGIGVISASSKLEVAGDVSATSLKLTGNLAADTGTFTGAVSGIAPTLAAHLTTKQYVDELVGGSNAIQQGDSSVAVTDVGTGVVKVNVDSADIFSFRNAGTTVDQGPVWFQSGTAGAPGISINGDTNTGIFSSAADTLNVSLGGTDEYEFTTNGLDISNNRIFSYSNSNNFLNWASGAAELAARDSITIRMDADDDDTDSTINFQNNAGTDLMTLNQSGYLTVTGNIGVAGAAPGASYGINNGNSYALSGANALNRSGTQLILGSSPTWTQLTMETGGVERVTIDSSGNVGIGTTTPDERLGIDGNIRIFGLSGAADKYIDFYSDVTINGGEGAQIGRLAFVGRQNDSDKVDFTVDIWNNDTDALIEAFRIDHTGAVGIGTTSPDARLEIDDNATAGDIMLEIDADDENPWAISFQNDTAAQDWGVYVANDDKFFFHDRTDTRDVLVLDGDGNVGIGVTNPSVALEVAGNVSASMPTANSHLTTKQYVDEQIGALSTSAIEAGDSSVAVTDVGTGVVKVNVDSADIFSFRNAGTTVDQGPVWFQDGSAGAPGISFAGDTDTGLFRPQANELSISTAATERMRIDSVGNVGIGTADPSAALDVVGDLELTGTLYDEGGTVLRIGDSDDDINIGQDGMLFDVSAGRLGIGTTTPGAKLTIRDTNTNTATTRFENTSGHAYVGLLPGGGLYLTNQITGQALLLGTNNTERIRIMDNGNVGIGTTSPGATLDVSGTTLITAADNHPLSLTSTGSVNYIEMDSTNATGILARHNGVAEGYMVWNGGNDEWRVFAGGGSSDNVMMTIEADGDVGIGAGNIGPTATLDVSGTAEISGDASVGGTLTANAFSGDGSNLTNINASSVGAAGSNTQLQFNNGGAFAGASNLYWDETNDRLGIGASPSDQKLHITDTSGTNLNLIRMTDATNTTVIGIYNDAVRLSQGDNGYFFDSGQVVIGNGANTQSVTLRGSRVNVNEELVVSGTGNSSFVGNVGIGLTTPASALDVSGTTRTNTLAVGTHSFGVNNLTGEGIVITNNGGGAAGRILLDSEDITSGYSTRIAQTDTGFQFESESNSRPIIFKTGATLVEAMRIEGDQQIAIGKTSASTALDVSGTVTATAFAGDGSNLTNINASSVGAAGSNTQLQFNNAGAFAGASNLYWDETNDRLGIGIAAPTQELHVNSGGHTNLLLSSTFSGSTTTGVVIDTVGDDSAGTILFTKSGVSRGGLSYNHNAAGAAERVGLTVAGNEHLSILGSGNVGIGITNPAVALDVSGTVLSRDGSDYVRMTSNAIGMFRGAAASNFIDILGVGDRLTIRTTETTDRDTTAMVILADGDIGIGTTSPAATLDVSGTIKVAGTNSEVCGAGTHGMIRYNSATGKMQVCRP